MEDWTLPQAIEFGKLATKDKLRERMMLVNDMALATAATQSKEANKSLQKFNREIGKEING